MSYAMQRKKLNFAIVYPFIMIVGAFYRQRFCAMRVLLRYTAAVIKKLAVHSKSIDCKNFGKADQGVKQVTGPTPFPVLHVFETVAPKSYKTEHGHVTKKETGPEVT